MKEFGDGRKECMYGMEREETMILSSRPKDYFFIFFWLHWLGGIISLRE